MSGFFNRVVHSVAKSKNPPKNLANATRSSRTLSPDHAVQKRYYNSSESPNPYQYTSGRWLHNEQERLATRSLDFDFQTLLNAAVKASPGAERVARYEKFEGGFNRVFVLHLDNAARVVARIPFSHAGAPRLRTNSEVATISYLRKNTKIPLPIILAWSDDPSNPIGSEYIIMEHAPGVQLHTHWPKMNGRQHLDCIKKLVEYMRDLSKLAFPAFGCLYFDNAPLPAGFKVDLGDGFCIGPSCYPDYWPTPPSEPRFYDRRPANHGPWADISEFTKGLIDNGYSRLPQSEPLSIPSCHGSISQHLTLLEQSERVLANVIKDPKIQSISAPLLLHPDLHKRNVFISESDLQITAFIDWQFASIMPTFLYAQDTPDFLFLHDHIDNLVTAEIGETTDTAARQERAQKIHQRVELYQKMYTTCVRGWIPKLWEATQTDQTLLRPFQYCGSSWRDSAPALRQELVELSQQWTSLGLPGTCLYQPSAAELEAHLAEYAVFEHVMDTKHALTKTIRCDMDGWVNNDAYALAKELCHEAYFGYLETVKEQRPPGMSEEEAIELWPFDTE